MKRVIITLVILLLLSQPVSAEWVDRDKVLHISAGMVIYSVAEPYTEKPMRYVILAGASKELADHLLLNGGVRAGDITATIIGGMISSYFLTYEF